MTSLPGVSLHHRVPLIVGNWKMNKSLSQARNDFKQIGELTRVFAHELQLGIAPVTLHLSDLAKHRPKHLGLYAQNVHWEESGACTGEHSAAMLAEVGIQGSIIAHSERRQMNGETNSTAGRKIHATLKQGLDVIYCVGESLQERETGVLWKVLENQIREAFDAAAMKGLGSLMSNPSRCRFSVAYEPVWAIGTGKAATEVEAQEAHGFIRKTIATISSASFASHVRILYGGSVKPENISRFMAAPDIDGALVGGASLEPHSFEKLCAGAAGSLRIKNI